MLTKQRVGRLNVSSVDRQENIYAYMIQLFSVNVYSLGKDTCLHVDMWMC